MTSAQFETALLERQIAHARYESSEEKATRDAAEKRLREAREVTPEPLGIALKRVAIKWSEDTRIEATIRWFYSVNGRTPTDRELLRHLAAAG